MHLRLIVVGLCLPVALCAQRPPSNALRDTVLGLEEQWRIAQQGNDTVAFRALLAPEVTFIGTSGMLRDGAGFIASRSGSWIPHAVSFAIDELRVREYGETVIVTGRETTTGPGTTAAGRFTHVWARHAATKWSLVAVQRTEIAPP